MKVIDQINGSALFAQSAYSASIATKDSLGRDITSTYLTEHQDLSNYATTGDLNSVSSFLSGAIDYVSANAGDDFPVSADEAIQYVQGNSATINNVNSAVQNNSGTWNSAVYDITKVQWYSGLWDSTYNTVESNSSKWNEISVYETNSANYLTAHQDISNKLDTTAFSTVSGTFLTAHQPISANEWNSVYDTVESNSGSWTGGGGGSVDTIPVAVISPLVTGFSGESAYLGIESTALNLSSYVPVSAIGVNYNGYVSGISGREISARYAYTTYTANNAQYAYRAYQDSNYNTITSYYQPKLTITGDAGTITSINGSAVGASIPEGWELVGSAGISIVDDADNNQTIISVTGGGAGGDTEVNDYVYNNSATIDNINSVVQSRSGVWNSAAYDVNKIQYYSALWDDTYSTVQVNSANWGGNPEVESYVQTNSASIDDAVSTYQSNSGSYITQETDWTNTITAASSYAYNEAVAQIPAPFDPTYMSGAIDQNVRDIQYISGVAITAHQDISNKLDTTAFSDVSGTFLTAVDLSNYYQKNETSGATELSNAFGSIVQGDADVNSYVQTNSSVIDEVNASYQTNSGTFLTAVNIPESANWNDATTAYQNNSASYLTAHQAISAEEWNSNYETVTTNSGAWGGSALPISAGNGISLSMVDGVLVISVTGGN